MTQENNDKKFYDMTFFQTNCALLFILVIGGIFGGLIINECFKPYKGEVNENSAIPSEVEVDVYNYQGDTTPETVIIYKGKRALLNVDSNDNLYIVQHSVVLPEGGGEQASPVQEDYEEEMVPNQGQSPIQQ